MRKEKNTHSEELSVSQCLLCNFCAPHPHHFSFKDILRVEKCLKLKPKSPAGQTARPSFFSFVLDRCLRKTLQMALGQSRQPVLLLRLNPHFFGLFKFPITFYAICQCYKNKGVTTDIRLSSIAVPKWFSIKRPTSLRSLIANTGNEHGPKLAVASARMKQEDLCSNSCLP